MARTAGLMSAPDGASSVGSAWRKEVMWSVACKTVGATSVGLKAVGETSISGEGFVIRRVNVGSMMRSMGSYNGGSASGKKKTKI